MRFSSALILIATSLLSACAGATTRFYTLEPSDAGATLDPAYAGPPFRIDAVHIPASLDRPELVRDDGRGRFVVADNDHWAAPVGELVRRALTQDLAARLPTGKVIYPDAPKPPGSAGLIVDILSIESRGDQMVMDLSWTFVPVPASSDQPAAAVRQHVLRVLTPIVGAGVSGDATELSALTAQASSAIAKDLSLAGN